MTENVCFSNKKPDFLRVKSIFTIVFLVQSAKLTSRTNRRKQPEKKIRCRFWANRIRIAQQFYTPQQTNESVVIHNPGEFSATSSTFGIPAKKAD
ncbi:MAG: hypothetical protein ACFCD0_13095 [Gemmataceae bacterium]